MNLQPLFDASPMIQLHTAAAIAAAIAGTAVLAARKGTRFHVAAGYVFALMILAAAISSFWIMEIRPGRLSFIHLLSVVTIVSIPLAIRYRRRGNIRAHAASMIGPFIGLVAAGAFTLLPGRVMHAVFF